LAASAQPSISNRVIITAAANSESHVIGLVQSGQPALVHIAANPYYVKFPYTPKEKFRLFAKDVVDPFNFMGESFNAFYLQAKGEPRAYGGGAQGYGKRLGAIVATDIVGEFSGTFVFPSLLHTDPRYFRMSRGPLTHRFFYALTRILVTRKDSGGETFNASVWLSGLAATAVSNSYYPDRKRGFGDIAERTAVNIGFDSLNNVLREFWPEVAHGLHIPVFVIRRTEDPIFPNQTASTQQSASQ